VLCLELRSFSESLLDWLNQTKLQHFRWLGWLDVVSADWRSEIIQSKSLQLNFQSLWMWVQPMGRRYFLGYCRSLMARNVAQGEKKTPLRIHRPQGVYMAPLWLFYREDCGIRNVADQWVGIVKSYGPLGRYRRQASDKIVHFRKHDFWEAILEWNALNKQRLRRWHKKFKKCITWSRKRRHGQSDTVTPCDLVAAHHPRVHLVSSLRDPIFFLFSASRSGKILNAFTKLEPFSDTANQSQLLSSWFVIIVDDTLYRLSENVKCAILKIRFIAINLMSPLCFI
jgi:hypothetical protein